MSTSTTRQTVIVIDDHPIVATAIQGIAMTIEGMEFMGAAKDCETGKTLAAKTQPNLAITDVSLPDGDGIDLIQAIREVSPKTRILAFSMNKEETLGPRVLKAGADGYLMKGAPVAQIQDAIRTVMSGQKYLSESLARTLAFRSLNQESAEGLAVALTNREFQVFRLIGLGKTTREISEFLKISVKTVETHRENMKNKLTCESGTQLSVKARDWVRENADPSDWKES